MSPMTLTFKLPENMFQIALILSDMTNFKCGLDFIKIINLTKFYENCALYSIHNVFLIYDHGTQVLIKHDPFKHGLDCINIIHSDKFSERLDQNGSLYSIEYKNAQDTLI